MSVHESIRVREKSHEMMIDGYASLGGGVKEEEEETYISALKYQQNGEPF